MYMVFKKNKNQQIFVGACIISKHYYNYSLINHILFDKYLEVLYYVI